MWIVWLCCIAAVLAVLTALAFKRMPIEFEYAASVAHKGQKFQVRVCHIRLIRDKKKKTEEGDRKDEKNTADAVRDGKMHKNKSGGQDSEKKSDEFGFSQFMEQIGRVKDIYDLIKADIEDVFTYLRDRARCRNLTVHLDFGFEDAAQTGIAAGVAYGVVYGFASMIYNHLSLRKDDMDIAVNPHFDKQCADLYIKSIFCLSPAHIIRVLVMLFAIHRKVRNINKQ